MPNWCENIIRGEGEVSDMNKFKEFVSSDDERFSFESIKPMPKELENVQSPVNIRTQEEIDEYKEQHKDDKWVTGFPITQETYNQFMKKYGCVTWYDWACEKWGTKWDARDVQYEDNFGGYEVVYRFDTAWGPPEPIYHILMDKFPMLNISWFYNEPGMEVAGYLHEGVNGF